MYEPGTLILAEVRGEVKVCLFMIDVGEALVVKTVNGEQTSIARHNVLFRMGIDKGWLKAERDLEALREETKDQLAKVRDAYADVVDFCLESRFRADKRSTELAISLNNSMTKEEYEEAQEEMIAVYAEQQQIRDEYIEVSGLLFSDYVKKRLIEVGRLHE